MKNLQMQIKNADENIELLKQCRQQVQGMDQSIAQGNQLLNHCRSTQENNTSQITQLIQIKIQLESQIQKDTMQCQGVLDQQTIQLKAEEEKLKQQNQKLQDSENHLLEVSGQLSILQGQQTEFNKVKVMYEEQQKLVDKLKEINTVCENQAKKEISEMVIKTQVCQQEREELRMNILNLRQEIRTMNISIHNDYRQMVQPIESREKQYGSLLIKCRRDLDIIAEMWAGSTNQISHILNRRFEYIREEVPTEWGYRGIQAPVQNNPNWNAQLQQVMNGFQGWSQGGDNQMKVTQNRQVKVFQNGQEINEQNGISQGQFLQSNPKDNQDQSKKAKFLMIGNKFNQ